MDQNRLVKITRGKVPPPQKKNKKRRPITTKMGGTGFRYYIKQIENLVIQRKEDEKELTAL